MATFDFSPHGDTPPAPGDLELLQRFINLHVHDAEGTHLEPPAEQIRGFLVERSLLWEQERFTHADRETYLALRDAIRNLILAGDDEPVSARDADVLDRIGLAAGTPQTQVERGHLSVRCRSLQARTFARLPHVDIEHHRPERFFERS